MNHSVRPFDISQVAPPKGLRLPLWPTASATLSSLPLDLEIGCGVGWHPIRYARENPRRRLIAIEHTRAKFERFRSRFEKNASPENLLPVHADAIRWVAHALPKDSIARCFFLYPNPEPKAPNKRWLRSPFMHRLLDAIQPGGELLLATNDRAYFEEALEFAAAAWPLKLVERREFSAATAPSEAPRTHFEKKYLLAGQTCFDVRWRRL